MIDVKYLKFRLLHIVEDVIIVYKTLITIVNGWELVLEEETINISYALLYSHQFYSYM